MTPDALKHAMEQIELNDEMQARVLRRSLAQGKEHKNMRHKRNYKRIAMASVAAVMVLSVTAFAAVRSQVMVSWVDPSDTIVDLAEAQQALKDTGSGLTLPENLAGFDFHSANVSHHMMAQEQQDAQTSSQVQVLEEKVDGEAFVYSFTGEKKDDGVSCIYRRGDEEVLLDADKLDDLMYDENGDQCDVVELEGQTFYCSDGATASTAMVTAEDGKVAASDIEEVQSGTYRCVSWQADGVTYSLSQIDGSLTREELCRMALELCGQK